MYGETVLKSAFYILTLQIEWNKKYIKHIIFCFQNIRQNEIIFYDNR